jgi:hypothetical protein
MEAAQEAVQHRVQRDPRTCEQSQTRWTLASIRQACDWLHGRSLPAVHQFLDRLNVVWIGALNALTGQVSCCGASCART